MNSSDIPSLSEYQVEIMEGLVNDGPKLFPIKVPPTITETKSRRFVQKRLKELAALLQLQLVERGAENKDLQQLCVTKKGALLFDVIHERTTSIQ